MFNSTFYKLNVYTVLILTTVIITVEKEIVPPFYSIIPFLSLSSLSYSLLFLYLSLFPYTTSLFPILLLFFLFFFSLSLSSSLPIFHSFKSLSIFLFSKHSLIYNYELEILTNRGKDIEGE